MPEADKPSSEPRGLRRRKLTPAEERLLKQREERLAREAAEVRAPVAAQQETRPRARSRPTEDIGPINPMRIGGAA